MSNVRGRWHRPGLGFGEGSLQEHRDDHRDTEEHDPYDEAKDENHGKGAFPADFEQEFGETHTIDGLK